MRAALIRTETKRIENVIEVPEDESFTPPEGHHIEPDPDGLAVTGGIYDAGLWQEPDVDPVLVAQQTRIQDATFGLDKIAEIPGVRTKLRAVAQGNDTLTAAQLQRLVAALALDALRNRADT